MSKYIVTNYKTKIRESIDNEDKSEKDKETQKEADLDDIATYRLLNEAKLSLPQKYFLHDFCSFNRGNIQTSIRDTLLRTSFGSDMNHLLFHVI